MAFEPENVLERSLVKAATDPAHRPQFYRDVLEAKVFILNGNQPAQRPRHETLEAGAFVPIETWQREGRSIIPMFSSLRRLQSFISAEAAYMELAAKDLFHFTKGTDLLLNPKSDYGKEFTAAEIASMLDGSIWKPTETWVAKKASPVMIGQPSRYPHELASVLRRYFESTPEVTRAFLAHIFDPSRDESGHTLIAIELDGDWDCVASGAGIVANSINVPDPPIDFMRMKGGEGIEAHLRNEVKPFYQKV